MAVNPSLGGEPARPSVPDGQAAYTAEPGRQPPLDPDEELRLARAVRAGDRRAAIRLVEANLRLVVAIARRYASCGVPYLELVQEGTSGSCRRSTASTPPAAAGSRRTRPGAYAMRCGRRRPRGAG